MPLYKYWPMLMNRLSLLYAANQFIRKIHDINKHATACTHMHSRHTIQDGNRFTVQRSIRKWAKISTIFWTITLMSPASKKTAASWTWYSSRRLQLFWITQAPALRVTAPQYKLIFQSDQGDKMYDISLCLTGASSSKTLQNVSLLFMMCNSCD